MLVMFMELRCSMMGFGIALAVRGNGEGVEPDRGPGSGGGLEGTDEFEVAGGDAAGGDTDYGRLGAVAGVGNDEAGVASGDSGK